MSEENNSTEETVVETAEKNDSIKPESNLIAESKKYRLRAQEAEKREQEALNKIADMENQRLKDKEDYKSLSEKQASELSELKPYREKYESEMQLQKEKLLNKIPENRRDEFKDESVKTLRGVVDIINENKSVEVPSARGSVGKQPPPEDWTNLSPQDMRKNWSSIVNNAIAKSKK